MHGLNRTRAPWIGAFLLAAFCTAGCAADMPANVERSEADPWEPMNRRIDSFNQQVDRYTLKPIAKGYQKVVPEFMRKGVTNFSSNLRGPLHIINNFLQGDAGEGFSETGRFFVNSTIGVFGLFDIASRMGFQRYEEDFGQTLAVWGVGSGPYIVVPFLGPTTLRDAVGFGVQTTFLYPVSYIDHDGYRAGLLSLNYVDFKADLLSAQRILDDASVDPYEFMKNAYLERRENLIHDREFTPFAEEDDLE